ncbi:uncharacterized protein C10orf67, mitochondrial-like [Rhopilema esculentum]|uniref:uncharacterized protein C10orf67, mitochondrial-like n=1 Tax=Rhopilema esculentum TaxID=499914 RepID=UPI0031D4343C
MYISCYSIILNLAVASCFPMLELYLLSCYEMKNLKLTLVCRLRCRLRFCAEGSGSSNNNWLTGVAHLATKKMAGQHDIDRIPSSITSSTKMAQSDNISNSEKGDDQEIGSNRSNGGSTFASIRPCLADKLRVGYFSMDRACQTEQSEIIDLKETTGLLTSLVQEVSVLKKTLNYTKLALQADYDAKIESRSVELYNRTNSHIAEIEELHKERVKVVRHSFRTQLADAICKISTDYHKYYALKGELQDREHQSELNKMAQIQEEQKQDHLAQQEMLDMMQLQFSHDEIQDDEESSTKSPSVSSEMERHAEEIRHLTDTISNLEDRIDEFSELLDQKNEEKDHLEKECQRLVEKLNLEQDTQTQLKKEVVDLKLEIETEKKNSRLELERQKEELQLAMQQRIEIIRAEAHREAEMKISDVENAAKRKEKAIQEQVKLEKEKLAESAKQVEKSISNDNLAQDLARMKEIDKMQRQEILRLQKELEKSNKTWEVKVTILQQTMHALKDEMFLRTSLKRQSAKLQHAAITYASDGPAAASAALGPTKPPNASRKYQLPNIIQGPRSGLHGDESSEDTPENDFRFSRKMETKRTSAPPLREVPSAPSPTLELSHRQRHLASVKLFRLG